MIDEVVDLDDARPVASQLVPVVYVVDDRRQPVSDGARHIVLAAVNSLQVRVMWRRESAHQCLSVHQQLQRRDVTTFTHLHAKQAQVCSRGTAPNVLFRAAIGMKSGPT